MLEIYLNIAELGPLRAVRRRGRRAIRLRPFGRDAVAAARRPCWRRSCPIRSRRSARNPGPGVRRLAGTYMARAQAPRCSAAGAKIAAFEPIFGRFRGLPTLALRHFILYKRGLIGIAARALTVRAVRFGRCLRNTPRGHRYGRSQKKNLAVAPWHAPFGRRAEEADLCRGQGFRRTAPSAPPRPEDRHVQGPSGSEARRNPDRTSGYGRFGERCGHAAPASFDRAFRKTVLAGKARPRPLSWSVFRCS